jgi:colanic acid/amylovoran biosynthesis glycosyltransferase
MKQDNLAIVTRGFSATSQTFVRRHLDYLNAGRTVVVGKHPIKAKGFPKPLYAYRKSRVNEYLRAFKLPGRDMYGSAARNRDGIREFFDSHQVSHALVEFGYVATDLGPAITQSGRPVYCMFRGNDASSRLNDRIYLRLLKQVFPEFSGIIAVSRHLLSNLEQHGLVHPRSIVVPSGVDTQVFKPGSREAGYCLCVGRLVEKKTPRPLIQAFAKIADANDLRLEFIGSGPEEATAKALTQELGIAERAIFTGDLSHDEVVTRMAKANFYFQHFQTPENGDTEGMPNVIQEAMACGLPIVTTRHAGIPDHLEDGINARLVEPGDVDGFASAINELCASVPQQERLGRAARNYAVENLDYRISHQRIEQFMGLQE